MLKLEFKSPVEGVADGDMAMNSQQRKCGPFVIGQAISCRVFVPTAAVALLNMTISLDLFVKKAGTKATFDCVELSESFKAQFNGQVFCSRQQLAMDMNGIKLDLTVDSFEHIDVGQTKKTSGDQVVHLLVEDFESW